MLDSEYSHVLSFRRQVYISDEDNTIIPETSFITHDNTDYRIYLSGDSPYCYKCKKQGHITTQCHATSSTSTTGNTQHHPPQQYIKPLLQPLITSNLPTQEAIIFLFHNHLQ